MKRKRIVAAVAVGFFTLMLLLTFFSNTILNSTLPVVRTQSVTGGTLTPKVSGSGTVESAGETLLTAEKQLTVLEVLVSAGDTVSAGTALLRVSFEDDGTLPLLQAQLKQAEDTYARALLSAEIPSGSANKATLQQMKNTLTAAQDNLSRNEDYQSQHETLCRQIAAAEGTLSAAQTAYTDGTSAAQEEYDAAEQAYTAAEAARQLAESNAAYAKTLWDKDSGKEQQYLEAAAALFDAEAAANEALNRRYTAEQNLSALQQRYAPELDRAKAVLSSLQESDAALEQTYAGCTDYLQCCNAVLSAQASIASFYDSLEAADISDQQQALDLQNQQDAIAALQEQIAGAEAALGEQTLTAAADGTVQTVSVNAGDSCPSGTALLQLENTAASYEVCITVSAEEANALHTGMTAKVDGGDSAAATLQQITAGTSETQLVFQISGDVSPGQSVALSVSLDGGHYDVLVPNSALYEDAQGYFVYTMEFSSSVLGNRCKAVRVPVQVLSEDSQYTAVDGALSTGTSVILYASAPLQSGQQVRLGE